MPTADHTRTSSDTTGLPAPTNICFVVGELSSDPATRTLPSGDVVTTYEVTVRSDGQPTSSVPVALIGGRPARLAKGDRVVASGSVRRRFFRAGATTASRTELVADAVVPADRARRVGQIVARVGDRIGRVAPEGDAAGAAT